MTLTPIEGNAPMFRARQFFRSVLLAGAVALISVPAAASAHGFGKFGYCYPRYCTPCYTSCYTPCYTTCSYPWWSYQFSTPCVQTYVVKQPLVIQQPYVQTVGTPYVASYGGCKVFIHKK